MAEIKVNSNNLSFEINKLRVLKQKIAAAAQNSPSVIGGGTTIQEIQNIGNKYVLLYDKVELLVDNTIAFMNNVNTSYVSSDKKASKHFK